MEDSQHLQQVLVINEHNPRIKWETLCDAVDGKQEEAEKLTVKQLSALVDEADGCAGHKKCKCSGKHKCDWVDVLLANLESPPAFPTSSSNKAEQSQLLAV